MAALGPIMTMRSMLLRHGLVPSLALAAVQPRACRVEIFSLHVQRSPGVVLLLEQSGHSTSFKHIKCMCNLGCDASGLTVG